MQKSMTVAALVCLSLVILALSLGGERKMEIVVRDVGQGDSISIYDENGNLLIIDGGPSNELVNMSFLKVPSFRCFVSGILLTHPDTDHVFGLSRLMELCEAGIVYYNNVEVFTSGNFSRFKELALASKSRGLLRGDEIKFGNFTLYILWPTPESLVTARKTAINEISICVLLDYKNFEMLFTADINSGTQNKLKLAEYAYVIEDGIDVYKVPHHGSKYSFDEEFMASLQPKTAVVSVGKNSYGHPSEDFVDYFEKTKTKLFRTDLEGSISIKIR